MSGSSSGPLAGLGSWWWVILLLALVLLWSASQNRRLDDCGC